MRHTRITRDIKLGIKSLMLHKLRSFLTILGVIFGVGSVVAMLAVGEGAGRQAMEQIRKLGSNNIIITSAKPQEDEEQSTQRSHMSIYGLFYDDANRIREAFENVSQTVPVKVVRKEGRLGTRAMELRIVGTTPAWFKLVRRPMIAGRPLLPRDLQGTANAVVLTEFGARKLLATQNTLGQTVRLGSGHYEVVGIVKSESGEAGGLQTPDQEVDAYIPLKSARERFGDVSVRTSAGSRIREKVELHQIIVEVGDIHNVEATAAGINRMLDIFHKRKDYRLSIPFALLRQAEQTQRTFNIVLGSIAGISLLVGGIGIMNIMLASVTERTRDWDSPRHRSQAHPDYTAIPDRNHCAFHYRWIGGNFSRCFHTYRYYQVCRNAYCDYPVEPPAFCGHFHDRGDSFRSLSCNPSRQPGPHYCAPARVVIFP